MTSEHVLKPGHVELTLTHHNASVHDGVSGANRAAAEPCLDEVGVGASESYAINRPHDKIGGRSGTQFAEFPTAAEASC